MNANSRAFPVGIAASALAPEYLQEGMSLRDYFAAKALQGELSAQSEESGFYNDFHILAKRCYEIADAMMKAREI